MPRQAGGALEPRPISRWGRQLAYATAGVFVLSSVFPVTAALSQYTASFPRWWGALDVAVAFVLAALALATLGVAQHRITQDVEVATYRAYRFLIHVILAVIIVFFLFGDRITWINGLLGIAWRGWLLLDALPAWFAAAKRTGEDAGSP